MMYSLSPIDQYFVDFYTVGQRIVTMWRQLFQTLFARNDYNFLFYTAILPFVLMFCADLIFSFILSFRVRKVQFFNVLSPASWKALNSNRLNQSVTSSRIRALNEVRYRGSDISPKYLRLSTLSLRLKNNYSKARVGDIIRCKDGERFIYCGLRLDVKNRHLYAYRNRGGVYYSTLKPSRWASSTGSARGDSIEESYKNNH